MSCRATSYIFSVSICRSYGTLLPNFQNCYKYATPNGVKFKFLYQPHREQTNRKRRKIQCRCARKSRRFFLFRLLLNSFYTLSKDIFLLLIFCFLFNSFFQCKPTEVSSMLQIIMRSMRKRFSRIFPFKVI